MATTPPKNPLAPWKKGLIYFIVLGLSAVLIWTQLPDRPYPTDLNLVGKGKPAIVLVYDVNTAGGMMVMELLKPLREEYDGQVEFLVASMGLPDGRAFAQHYRISSGAVVFFSADSSQNFTVRAPDNTEELRLILERTMTKSKP
jgi:hypothetical protein